MTATTRVGFGPLSGTIVAAERGWETDAVLPVASARCPASATRSPTSDEGRRSEELMGQEGFAEESSLLYHRHSPSRP